ncbi:hypothetical protein PUNSTDRAFT_60934 [Punctularia strigosozonata HHB-11173 SS5]|uniref:uncharacterized protein n=1 Tax=Punctularia strigosozonata (strain HHB-11173) TaxID=741275 RepID=UPI0004416337|nr:uncharacterized protein PUNSTDRAFT_60934 [Punctularia strigosozonata HHB-11173 SS5]EIN12335.1 hypothetical protein PUNSTDRAFT_60934 [Punctularia strigosozonata HHB-11173 SS5]
MKPKAEELICQVVYDEMDQIKGKMTLKVLDITDEHLSQWSFRSSIQDPITEAAPTLCRILTSAAQTSKAQRLNKKKQPDVLVAVIVSQLANHRSRFCISFAGGFSLTAYFSGCSELAINLLNKCGLSISYDSLMAIFPALADSCIELARQLAQSPDGYSLGYDNTNVKTSIHVEQRRDAPAKVQSGTASCIYTLYNIHDGSALELKPILANWRRITRLPRALSFKQDIRPNPEQIQAFDAQSLAHILRVLTTHVDAFKKFEDDPLFSYLPRRKLSDTRRQRAFPLRTTTIEEASVAGNIQVHNNIHLEQLGMTRDKLENRAIPLGVGLFHLLLNLLWCVLGIHRGKDDDLGSLSWFFVLVSRTRLGAQHPDFHLLKNTLAQIFDGLILHFWLVESGCSDFTAFAAKNCTAEELTHIARCIQRKYTTIGSSNDNETGDLARENIKRLLRDLLYIREVDYAIRDGDWGRIEDILGPLCMMFRAGGSNNYSTEIMHLILQLKYIWPSDFA